MTSDNIKKEKYSYKGEQKITERCRTCNNVNDRKYYHSDKGQIRFTKHRADPKTKTTQKLYQLRTQRRDNQKLMARRFIRDVLRNGKLIKLKICNICGKEGKTDIHHFNYELDPTFKNIIEVCRTCHRSIENESY